jgi:hypothetical protein
MFTDEAVSWPADVKFTGEFTEPTIVTLAAPVDTQYVVRADKNESEEEVVEDPSDYKFKVADAGRLHFEAEQKHDADLGARITRWALSAFNDAWNTQGKGKCTVRDTTSTWNKESNNGDITIVAEILDGKDTKSVSFVVSVNGSTMKLPDFAQLPEMLKEAKVVDRTIQGENIHRNIELEKTAAVEKKATPSAPQHHRTQDILRMPKDFLPKTLKVGDVIEVDGLHYKLSSKSEGQLSTQKDSASYWLFERINYEQNKPVYKQQSY